MIAPLQWLWLIPVVVGSMVLAAFTDRVSGESPRSPQPSSFLVAAQRSLAARAVADPPGQILAHEAEFIQVTDSERTVERSQTVSWLDVGTPLPALLSSPSGKLLLCVQKFVTGYKWRQYGDEPMLRLVLVEPTQMQVVAQRELRGIGYEVTLGDQYVYVLSYANHKIAALSLTDLRPRVVVDLPEQLHVENSSLFHESSSTLPDARQARLRLAAVGNAFLYVAKETLGPAGRSVGRREPVERQAHLRLDLVSLQPSEKWNSTNVAPTEARRIGDQWYFDRMVYDPRRDRPILLTDRPVLPQVTLSSLGHDVMNGEFTVAFDPFLQAFAANVPLFETIDGKKRLKDREVRAIVSNGSESLLNVMLGTIVRASDTADNQLLRKLWLANQLTHYDGRELTPTPSVQLTSVLLDRGRLFVCVDGQLARIDIPPAALAKVQHPAWAQMSQSVFVVDYLKPITVQHQIPPGIGEPRPAQGNMTRLQDGSWEVHVPEDFWGRSQSSFTPIELHDHLLGLFEARPTSEVLMVPFFIELQLPFRVERREFFFLTHLSDEARQKLADEARRQESERKEQLAREAELVRQQAADRQAAFDRQIAIAPKPDKVGNAKAPQANPVRPSTRFGNVAKHLIGSAIAGPLGLIFLLALSRWRLRGK